jgi:peptidoglycan/xylan/chitin deacetylase (PgdA/CDA1 family)
MRVAGAKSVKRFSRWLRSRLVDGALILSYHRIADVDADPYGLCVAPQHFAKQLEILRAYGHPMSLQELVQALVDSNLPRGAFALTFDDGYNDNLHVAKPLLERYQIPATVFVATGYLGREFWWDELQRIVLMASALPARLHLTINETGCEWNLGAESQRGSQHAVTRQRFLHSLYRLLQTLAAEERRQVMNQLWAWAGVHLNDQPRHRALACDEVVRLAEGGLVEIGAHTVTHPVLAALPPAMQRLEIVQSKVQLEALLAQPVRSFSYPNGSLSDSTIGIVREADFMCACRSFNDIVWRRSDRFQLPRFWVGNWNHAAFSHWLARWLKN